MSEASMPAAPAGYLDERCAAIGTRPFVVVSDTHYADNYEIYCTLAEDLRRSGILVVLVTEHSRPEQPNMLPVSILKVAPEAPEALQARYPFSLFKPIACERSFTDYCTFRRDEIYSDVDLHRFLDRYTRFARVYERLFLHGGVFVGMPHDTFKSALASPGVSVGVWI